MTAATRVIIDQVDPEHLVPGGTDTCIHDLVKYAAAGSILIVGISTTLALGTWHSVSFAGREVQFLPVARVDRTARRKLLPHSLRVTFGIVRHRRTIMSGAPGAELQAHRIEIGAALLKLFRRPLVQFIHNDSRGLTGSNSDSRWKSLGSVYRRIERTVLTRARAVVLFNESDSARVKAIRPDAHIARTWFDPEVFALSRSAAVSADDPIAVCWVARLEAQKDPILAIDTIAAVRRARPGSSLRIVGTGSLERAVRTRIEELDLGEAVSFTGALPRPDVARVMSESDVLLLTSHYEGSPRVLAEAGAVGLPVAASAGADPDRALDGRTNGARVTARDASKLAQAVLLASSFDPAGCARSVIDLAAPKAVGRLLAL